MGNSYLMENYLNKVERKILDKGKVTKSDKQILKIVSDMKILVNDQIEQENNYQKSLLNYFNKQ